MEIVILDLRVRLFLDRVSNDSVNDSVKVLLGDREFPFSSGLKGREHLFLTLGNSFLTGYLEVEDCNPPILEGTVTYSGELTYFEELLLRGIIEIQCSNLCQVIVSRDGINSSRLSFCLFWHCVNRFPKGAEAEKEIWNAIDKALELGLA